MSDKAKKALAKLSPKEREVVKLLLMRLKMDDVDGLDIKRLKGHSNMYRVRRGDLRIIFTKDLDVIKVLRIDRRGESTYKNL